MTAALKEDLRAQRADLIDKYHQARAAYLEVTPASIAQHSVAVTNARFDAVFQMMADIGNFNRLHPKLAITNGEAPV
ncbi:MAG TPA: hypothetical protein VHR97_01710 [Candidatus Baltobacteraceae bacterium]|jgi:hypothetical protein|nr:hypothetical protein [Candidatus Baltobacteraceae bacterium]